MDGETGWKSEGYRVETSTSSKNKLLLVCIALQVAKWRHLATQWGVKMNSRKYLKALLYT